MTFAHNLSLLIYFYVYNLLKDHSFIRDRVHMTVIYRGSDFVKKFETFSCGSSLKTPKIGFLPKSCLGGSKIINLYDCHMDAIPPLRHH